MQPVAGQPRRHRSRDPGSFSRQCAGEFSNDTGRGSAARIGAGVGFRDRPGLARGHRRDQSLFLPMPLT